MLFCLFFQTQRRFLHKKHLLSYMYAYFLKHSFFINVKRTVLTLTQLKT